MLVSGSVMLFVWWLEKMTKQIPQTVVNTGDESNARNSKKSPN